MREDLAWDSMRSTGACSGGGRWAVVVGLALTVVAASALPATASAPPTSFSIDVTPSVVPTGGSIQVSGQGCPPSGSLLADEPLVIYVARPFSSHLSPSLQGGAIKFVVVMSNPPEPLLTASVTPLADGTFVTTISVGQDFPPRSDYTVFAMCAARFQANPAGTEFTPESVVAGGAGPVPIEIVSSTTSTTIGSTSTTIGSTSTTIGSTSTTVEPAVQPTTTEAPGALRAQPAFTG